MIRNDTGELKVAVGRQADRRWGDVREEQKPFCCRRL